MSPTERSSTSLNISASMDFPVPGRPTISMWPRFWAILRIAIFARSWKMTRSIGSAGMTMLAVSSKNSSRSSSVRG